MELRKFIRHPADIPIEIVPWDTEQTSSGKIMDVSLGGVAYRSVRCLAVGSPVQIRIFLVQPTFDVTGIVVWCRPAGDAFVLGICFTDPEDAFEARMIEQICHIEHYRRAMLEQEGRVLTTDEAAREWIAKFAAAFPDPENKSNADRDSGTDSGAGLINPYEI